MKKNYAFLSVAAASILALSACGSADGESSDPEEDIQDVPALSEIEETMWDTMEASESVTITASPEDLGAAGLDNMGLGSGDVTFYGNIDGSASGFTFGDSDAVVAFDEQAYMSADYVFGIFGGAMAEQVGEQERQLIEAIADELQGYWVDQSGEYDPEVDPFGVDLIISESRDQWFDSEDDDPSSSEYGDEGTLEEHDGVDVWVYSEGDSELIVEADHDAPRILEATEDGGTITFSDWDSTEEPERPDEDLVIDEGEFDELLSDVAEEQGLS